jgi:branched-chain amino acid transport system ATP-binding protein
MTTLLEVAGISKSYGGVAAVTDVSFTLVAGEILALIGPNGAGKSTCFNMLNGQIRPDSGDIRINGATTIGLPPREVWRRGVGRTFQIAATFGSMTVIENVQMALLSHHRHLARLWGYAGATERGEAERLLDLVGMKASANRASAELAYGDVKRLELAIALANRPRLLLMDEPTAGMAPKERIALMQLTADISRSETIGVLFTEHDMDVVFEHATRVMVLSRGRLIAEGAPQDVRADAQVRAIYLGDGLTYDARHQQSEVRP